MFECRANEVFWIDMDGIRAQVTSLLSTVGGDSLQLLKVVQTRELGNEYYRVSPSYLSVVIIALDPRPGISGVSTAQLEQPNNAFEAVLRNLDSKKHDIGFLVRDDSFAAFRMARKLASQLGYDVDWELLGSAEPIKFGQGGGSPH